MSTIKNPIFYTPPTHGFKQTLGHGIARYGLFSFLRSDRANSDMYYYVQKALPPQLKSFSQEATQKTTKRAIKRKIMTRMLSLFPAAFQTLQRGGQALTSPFVAVADAISGRMPDGEFAHDFFWGTTTVKTDSTDGDLLWSTLVKLGSHSQPLRVNIDTGSADFFAYDPKCDSCALQTHTAFAYAQSSTFTPLLNISFNADYADGGNVGGYLAQDSLDFGGGVKIPQQTFGLATVVSDNWQALSIDGLMGLGPDSLSSFPPPQHRGVFTQLVKSNVLADDVIGIALAKASGKKSGEFSFGRVNGDWIRGGASQMIWVNVSSQNFWGTELSGIFVNGVNVMAPEDPPRAIVDTGTSLMLVTAATAARIHSTVPGAAMDPTNGVWSVPCPPPPPQPTLSQPRPSPASVAENQPNQDNGWSSIFSRMFGRTISYPKHRRGFWTAYSHPRPVRAVVQPTGKPHAPNVFVQFGAGSPRYGIPGSDLAYQKIAANETNALSSDGVTPMCYSGIQAGADGFVVLGGTFIKNNYIGLKYMNNQKVLGFGARSDLPVLR